MYGWINLLEKSNEILICSVNDFLNDSKETTPTDEQKPILFGALNRKDGYFEIDWNGDRNEECNFHKMVIVLKNRELD